MPIRIRDRATADTVSRSRPAGQSATKLTSAPASFGDQLAVSQRSLLREDLDRLYVDVEEQGRRLMEQPTPEELAKYKQHVRDFVAYVVKHGLKLKTSLSSRELHQIIDRVDEELLNLADSLLAREKSVMEMASKIDHINGILFDLKA